MRLKMTANLGYRDAKRLGLDQFKATEGATIDADEDAAAELLKNGWATEPGTKDVKSAPAAGGEDFDEMTKEELKAYADAHGIAGVTMAMAKDDMTKAVKRGAKG